MQGKINSCVKGLLCGVWLSVVGGAQSDSEAMSQRIVLLRAVALAFGKRYVLGTVVSLSIISK